MEDRPLQLLYDQSDVKRTATMDATGEAKKIAFDRIGSGEAVLLISGFPQTRRSWDKVVPLLSRHFTTVAADLPSFGDSGILAAPATTENAARKSFTNSSLALPHPCTLSPTISAPGSLTAGRCCFLAISSR